MLAFVWCYSLGYPECCFKTVEVLFYFYPCQDSWELLSLCVRVKRMEVGSSTEGTMLSAGANELWLCLKLTPCFWILQLLEQNGGFGNSGPSRVPPAPGGPVNSSYGGGKCPSVTTSLSHRLFTGAQYSSEQISRVFSAGNWLYHSKELIVLLCLLCSWWNAEFYRAFGFKISQGKSSQGKIQEKQIWSHISTS